MSRNCVYLSNTQIKLKMLPIYKYSRTAPMCHGCTCMLLRFMLSAFPTTVSNLFSDQEWDKGLLLNLEVTVHWQTGQQLDRLCSAAVSSRTIMLILTQGNRSWGSNCRAPCLQGEHTTTGVLTTQGPSLLLLNHLLFSSHSRNEMRRLTSKYHVIYLKYNSTALGVERWHV